MDYAEIKFLGHTLKREDWSDGGVSWSIDIDDITLSVTLDPGETHKDRCERALDFNDSMMGRAIKDVFGPQKVSQAPLDPPTIEARVFVKRPYGRGTRTFCASTEAQDLTKPDDVLLRSLETSLVEEMRRELPKSVQKVLAGVGLLA